MQSALDRKPRSPARKPVRWTVGLAGLASGLVGAGARADEAPVATAPSPAIFLQPSMTVQETFTDNATFTPRDRIWDLVTRALLSLDARLDDGRAKAQVDGSLGYDLYARTPDRSGVYAAGSGSASYALVPDLVRLNLDGSTSLAALSPFGRTATDRPGAGQNVQITTYAVGPDLSGRTADGVTVNAAARFAQVFYSNASNGTLPVPRDDSIAQLTATVRNDPSHRLEVQSSLEFLRDAHDFTSIADVQSAFLRMGALRLVGRVGYDGVTQGRLLSISSPLVSAGFEYQPNSKSKVTIEAGTRYGRPAWAIDASLDLSPRLVASASYTEEVEPDQVGIARSFFSFGALAQDVPARLVPQTFAVSGDLTDATSLSRSAKIRSVYDDAVNTLALTADWTNSQFLTIPGRDRTLVVDATFTRRVHPDLNLILRANYAWTVESEIYGPSEAFGEAIEVAYRLNSRTDLTIEFSHTQNSRPSHGNEQITENALVESLRRSF